jgi:hypothetical protein
VRFFPVARIHSTTLIRETEVAGHVASPSPIGATSPTIGLYGTTNTSRLSGLVVTVRLLTWWSCAFNEGIHQV